jgi:hypothetical protein
VTAYLANVHLTTRTGDLVNARFLVGSYLSLVDLNLDAILLSGFCTCGVAFLQ